MNKILYQDVDKKSTIKDLNIYICGAKETENVVITINDNSWGENISFIADYGTLKHFRDELNNVIDKFKI